MLWLWILSSLFKAYFKAIALQKFFDLVRLGRSLGLLVWTWETRGCGGIVIVLTITLDKNVYPQNMRSL
jgi:hypothetical protein